MIRWEPQQNAQGGEQITREVQEIIDGNKK